MKTIRFNRITTSLLVMIMLAGSVSVGYFQRAWRQDNGYLVLSAASTIDSFDFTVPYSFLSKTMKDDIVSHQPDYVGVRLNWIEILAYLATNSGGNFKKASNKQYASLITRLKAGEKMADLSRDMKYYPYYYDAYAAALGGLLGEFAQEEETDDGAVVWRQRYGLKAFSPIARGFGYTDGDDFGNKRVYGHRRRHKGHDLFTSTGTPIIAIESGTVEELGWNRYGGWRVGIRSLDRKRYYYYAHMRKDRPYAENLEKGARVMAGDVIGYVGRTGYSTTENVDNMARSHLHLGLMLIFDEWQEGGEGEVWIDLVAITRLLKDHTSRVAKDPETKEYRRKYRFEG